MDACFLNNVSDKMPYLRLTKEENNIYIFFKLNETIKMSKRKQTETYLKNVVWKDESKFDVCVYLRTTPPKNWIPVEK